MLRLIVALAVAATAASLAARADAMPLRTAVLDSTAFAIDPATAFAHVKAAGAQYVRIVVDLSAVAPGGATKPTSFDPTNPGDPQYNWSGVDSQVRAAVAAGLDPILCVFGVPEWAHGPSDPGSYANVSAMWYGKFAVGVARRYSGAYLDLPRIAYYQAWNEPNLGANFEPQRGNTTLLGPELYRSLVNAFDRGIKSVRPDDLVVAGGLAPYASTSGPSIPPLTFMRQFLCLTGSRIRPRPACLKRADFDIWAIQPYTWGGPTHTATVPGDLALGDLPAMKSTLDAAIAAGKIVSTAPVQFWVTEFSWDTNPPDPGAVPMDLQTRWTAEALYRMWSNGISLVTWFLIRDQPFPARWQSGLYFNGGANMASDTPKPTFEAFRFPTVAFVQAGGIFFWARTPAGTPGTVRVQQDVGDGTWTTIATLSTDGDGIATGLIPATSTSGQIRAQLVATGEAGNGFSLTPIPDQDVNPFGN